MLTNHRLVFVDALRALERSVSLELALVRQTEFWAGFLTSSAKITLLLGDTGAAFIESAPPSPYNSAPAPAGAWVCRICGFSNPASRGATPRCTLCGVASESRTPSRPSTPAAAPAAAAAATASTSEATGASTSGNDTPTTDAPKASAAKRRACPACTFINHPSMTVCEVCGTRLDTPTPPPTPTPRAGAGAGGAPFVRLSFRKGGDRTFYTALKKALDSREWETPTATAALSGAGIDAILKGLDLETRGRSDEMDDALKDLNALMAKAKVMVRAHRRRAVVARSPSSHRRRIQVDMARSINERLKAGAPAQDETAIRSSLVQLGLEAPAVTADTDQYHKELARELSSLLSHIVGDRIVGLDQVWCLYNRARGVALVSPRDFVLALPHVRLTTRRFPSGLTVLHTSRFSDRAYASRLLEVVDLRSVLSLGSSERTGISDLEIAQLEHIPVGIAHELSLHLERRGWLCRDDQAADGVRWHRNYFAVADSGVQ